MSVTREDLLEAKRELSLRVLRPAPGTALAPAWVPALRVAAARAQATVNVHAVGVGQKEVDGKPVKQRCVRFYVIQKLPESMYDARVGMDHADPSVFALFENQLRIQRASESPAFGLGGDSGSLVVAADQGMAVGLYFAGPGDGSYGVANQFEDVLRELEIELL